MPSMVAITNKGVQEVQSYFYGQTYQQETESTGSGVIIGKNDDELLIATNNHVVSGAQTLSVCFSVDAEDSDDLVVSADVEGTDPNHDLAIVTVKLSDISDDVKSKIKVMEVGSSDNLALGEQVVAIGNALGYGQSVTSGIVSALDREVTVETDERKYRYQQYDSDRCLHQPGQQRRRSFEYERPADRYQLRKSIRYRR